MAVQFARITPDIARIPGIEMKDSFMRNSVKASVKAIVLAIKNAKEMMANLIYIPI